MALKSEKKDNLEYLNELLEESGIEIILPNIDNSEEDEEQE